MWFRNLKIYRLSAPWSLFGDDLEAALERHAFKPGSNLEMQSLGWFPPRENGGLAHVVNGQILLTLRAESKLLPTSVINQVAKARAQEIEDQQGYKPGRQQMKEIKERVTDELLPRAFSVYRDTRVWIDSLNRWLVIDTAASSKADEVIGLLAKCVDPFKRFRGAGLDTAEIAAIVHCSRTHVENYLILADAERDVQEMVRACTVSAEVATASIGSVATPARS